MKKMRRGVKILLIVTPLISLLLMITTVIAVLAEVQQELAALQQLQDEFVALRCDGTYDDKNIDLHIWSEGSGNINARSGQGMAELIASTAERFAWPKKASRKKYYKKKGGKAVKAMHEANKQYYGDREDADCNHFAQTVLSAARGKKVKSDLSFYGNSDNEKNVEKELSAEGFTVFAWDGKEKSLRRGDIVFYSKKGGGFHTYVYLAKNTVAHAQLHAHGGTYGHISGFGGTMDDGMSNKKKCVIVRHTSAAANATPEGADEAGDEKSPATYDDITILGTIPKSQGRTEKLAKGGNYTFQSFCYNSGYFYMMRPKKGNRGSDGYIYKYQQEGMKAVVITKDNPIGHGNGCTYCTADDKVYSVTVNGVRNNEEATVINPETLEIEGTHPLEHGSSTIAYDRITNWFITGSGAASGKPESKGHLYIYESDLKTPAGHKSITKLRWRHPGDMCAYNGIIYCCTYIKWDENYIDMYSEDTGKYLGSYSCPHEEIEGIDIDDNGEVILLFKGSPSYLQYTGITVQTSGTWAIPLIDFSVSGTKPKIGSRWQLTEKDVTAGAETGDFTADAVVSKGRFSLEGRLLNGKLRMRGSGKNGEISGSGWVERVFKGYAANNEGMEGSATYVGVDDTETDLSRKVVAVTGKWSNKKNPYKGDYCGKCEAWVCDVYHLAGLGTEGACCAYTHGKNNASRSGKIPKGAFIFSGKKPDGSTYRSFRHCTVCGNNPGHVAIYIGGGLVAGSQPKYIMTLDAWIDMYGYGGWSLK